MSSNATNHTPSTTTPTTTTAMVSMRPHEARAVPRTREKLAASRGAASPEGSA
jgi:hypothetical protein